MVEIYGLLFFSVVINLELAVVYDCKIVVKPGNGGKRICYLHLVSGSCAHKDNILVRCVGVESILIRIDSCAILEPEIILEIKLICFRDILQNFETLVHKYPSIMICISNFYFLLSFQ